MIDHSTLFRSLNVAVYVTDAQGFLTYYNAAAAELWGHRPELGTARWCGAWRLRNPDGTMLAASEGPLALSLRDRQPVRDAKLLIERPDGSRVLVLSVLSLVDDHAGDLAGAIDMMIEVTDRSAAAMESALLAAIVSSSEDSIISKTLDGTITSWNAGARRIFGYEADEIIGQSILRLIPPELRHEEDEIIASLRRGERVEHFDTVRMAKDGRRVDISLTISPIRDTLGIVVGASQIARDISERRRSEELQRLLFAELNHRVKNTLAMIQAIARQSLRRSTSPADFVDSFNGRVQALSRAHDLIVQRHLQGAELSELVDGQVSLGAPDRLRITSGGPRVFLDARNAVQLGLVLHELATNARKHGALAKGSGRLTIEWSVQLGSSRDLIINWIESDVADLKAPTHRGFGSTLIERSLQANGGEAIIRYASDGLTCRIRIPLVEVETGVPVLPAATIGSHQGIVAAATSGIRGKRILVIEDEPLVATDIEAHLKEAGCIVLGPASTSTVARKLIAEQRFDAALVDANLSGEPVDDLVAAIVQKGKPFAFASGYERATLPSAFRSAPYLAKPFTPEELVAVLSGLFAEDRVVHRLHRKGPPD